MERVRNELLFQKEGLEQAVAARTGELVTVNDTLRQGLLAKDGIQQQQNRLVIAIEKLGEAITITDIEGRIVYTNPAFTEMTGYSAEEVLGKNPRILKSGRHPESFYCEFWKSVLSQGNWSGRFINRRKDGTLYTEDTTITAVRNDLGKLVSYVAIKRDVTKELELERQLLQGAKLESIGTMAAGIAHEINTPVQYIGSNLEFLAELPLKPKTGIKRVAHRCCRLTDIEHAVDLHNHQAYPSDTAESIRLGKAEQLREHLAVPTFRKKNIDIGFWIL